jgi:DNA-binding CsgD family transcriptional regulator
MGGLQEPSGASFSATDRALAASVARRLDRIRVRGSADEIFAALADCAPIIGGLVGHFQADRPEAAVSHVVKLPASLFEGWADAPPAHFQRMLAPLTAARSGQLIADRAIQGRFRDELDLLHRLRGEGLGEAAGFKIADAPGPFGGTVHHFMTFALDRNQVFKPRHQALLESLLPTLEDALGRLRIPLIASEPIFAQVLADEELGYLCSSPSGRVVEFNRRAHVLVERYRRAAHVEGGRGMLERFVAHALRDLKGRRAIHLPGPDGASSLRVAVHWLAKESHATSEDILLLLLQESTPPPLLSFEHTGLTERQAEIAALLCGSGLSYKQVAARLDIAPGTMRKHAENIFRRLGVCSRSELHARFKAP